MKKLLLALLLFLAAPLSAQTLVVVDTIPIPYIEGTLGNVQIAAIRDTVAVGDTLLLTAQAYDTDGDTISALYAWDVSNNDIINLLQLTGQQVRAVVLRKLLPGESGWIRVQAQKVTRISLGNYRTRLGLTDFHYGPTEEPEGGTVQYCAYAFDGGDFVGQNVGEQSSPCPELFGAPSPLRQAQALYYERQWKMYFTELNVTRGQT